MDFDEWARREGVEGLGSARHCTRVPVFQHAAGVEHEWILRVRQVIGLAELARHELATAARRREVVLEEDRLALRVFRIWTRQSFPLVPRFA